MVVCAVWLMGGELALCQQPGPATQPALPTAAGQPDETQPSQTVKPALPEAEVSPAAAERAQTVQQPTAAAPQSTQQSNPQEPGAGAQVRTGSTISGVEGLLNRLAVLLSDHQIPEVEKLIDESDAAAKEGRPAPLTPQQSQLYRGVLDNRENKLAESVALLEPLVKQMRSGPLAPDEKLLRKTLAEDYLRAGEWRKAAQAYQDFQTRLGPSLTADEQDEIELPLKLLPLAAANPPMTVEVGDAFALPYDRDALGLTDIPVFVDAQSHDWMLDPTAPFNLICHSTAWEVGLKVSDQVAIVHTLTGRPMEVRATVIPRLTLGTITFRNMTAFVFEDTDYYFPRSKYQVRGVLGYPAISALGSLTVTANARIEVQPGEKGERLTHGARFFLDGDRVIAALGKEGDERMFVLDAGGQQTYLSSRYYAEHESEFADKKMQLLDVPGAKDKPPAPAYVMDTVSLTVGDTPVNFHYLQVLQEPLAAAAVDDTYGTLGVDALDELKSYTFDYRTMRFAAKNQ